MKKIEEIFATISILIKFGFCNIVEDQNLLIQFLIELKVIKSRREFINAVNIDKALLNEHIEDFNKGFRKLEQKMTMYGA